MRKLVQDDVVWPSSCTCWEAVSLYANLMLPGLFTGTDTPSIKTANKPTPNMLKYRSDNGISNCDVMTESLIVIHYTTVTKESNPIMQHATVAKTLQ